ncbi:hypothetical protein AB0J80_29495 [Actinoplanes sp. NPDC049548]|uniref:hypothetical protein n=1 Tax=Actinoplanes sp. NPDC049548 TaxID=3155152 RepID=UPI0034477B21
MFRGLLDENADARGRFLASLSRLEPEVMARNRPLRLWDSADQSVDLGRISTNPTDGSVNRLTAVPATIGGCAGQPGTIPTPDFVTGRNLPHPLLLGLYAGGWAYSVCWDDARWSAGRNVAGQTHQIHDPHDGGAVVFIRDWKRVEDRMVDIKEYVTSPGPSGKVLGRTTTGRSQRVVCSWTQEAGDPPAVPARCTGHPADGAIADRGFGATEPGVSPAGAGVAPAEALLDERRAQYFDLVADKLQAGALPEARALNTSLRLVQAYTDLGFPRAKETDEQLSALVYGSDALPADLPGTMSLRLTYRRAAANLRAGTPATQDQPRLGASCLPAGGADGDPVAACVSRVGRDRAAALLDRYEVHSRAVHRHEEVQTLPLVDEAIDNLQLVKAYVRAHHAG